MSEFVLSDEAKAAIELVVVDCVKSTVQTVMRQHEYCVGVCAKIMGDTMARAETIAEDATDKFLKAESQKLPDVPY